MKIRQFDEGDTAAVIALRRKCRLLRPWNDPLKDIQRQLAVQRKLFLVGGIDGKVMANAMAGYDGHRGSLFYSAVAPEHQRKGHGSQLLGAVEALLLERECTKLNFPVRTSNVSVRDFYRNLGYELDDVATRRARALPRDRPARRREVGK